MLLRKTQPIPRASITLSNNKLPRINYLNRRGPIRIPTKARARHTGFIADSVPLKSIEPSNHEDGATGCGSGRSRSTPEFLSPTRCCVDRKRPRWSHRVAADVASGRCSQRRHPCDRLRSVPDPPETGPRVHPRASGHDQSRAAIEILQPWAAANPSSATTRAASFPEGELQEIALRTTVGTSAGREPIAAAEWIEKLPTASNKEQAIGAYTVALAETDPAAAVRRVETLPDEELRNNRAITLAKRWLDLNETAARSWSEKSPLSPSQKRRKLIHPPKP